MHLHFPRHLKAKFGRFFDSAPVLTQISFNFPKSCFLISNSTYENVFCLLIEQVILPDIQATGLRLNIYVKFCSMQPSTNMLIEIRLQKRQSK